MQDFIAVNAGPKFLAREDALKQTNEVCKALVNYDPVAAGAALLPNVNLRCFVGNAALMLTPLLWACKNAEIVNNGPWNDLIKALLNAGADANVLLGISYT